MSAAPLIIVAGARPNFVKVAPLLRELATRALPHLLVHTGQHYDHAMSGVFFQQLAIREPDVHLEVGSGSHATQTAAIMVAFERYVLGLPQAPRGVVVVGDVNSTMACALVATKLHLRVAHVEAGLRSRDREMPEEVNRIVTDAIADLLLVSEPDGMTNLAAEGHAPRARYVGNVMIDSLVAQLPAAHALDVPGRFGVTGAPYVVVTLHRPSNVDSAERLAALVGLLRDLARLVTVVFPVHPRTRQRLSDHGFLTTLAAEPRIRITEPLGYVEFLGLLESARVVVSDSGGIQEETTFLGVPCVTLRTTTERPVTISAGTNRLAGDDLERALHVVREILAAPMPSPAHIDGWDGEAARRVVDVLAREWA